MKNHTQKGAVSGAAIAIIVIAIIALIGVGAWWTHSASVATNDTAGIPNTGTEAASSSYSYVIGTASSTTDSPTVSEPKTITHTYTTYVKKTVPTYSRTANAYSGLYANTYHNSTYGLTLHLPSAEWRTYVTAGGPSNLSGTAQIHFVAPGESTNAFVVNVWNKEQWNYVRNQENYVHLNTTNIGEGSYLGENFTWIYSDIIYSHAVDARTVLSGAVFY